MPRLKRPAPKPKRKVIRPDATLVDQVNRFGASARPTAHRKQRNVRSKQSRRRR